MTGASITVHLHDEGFAAGLHRLAAMGHNTAGLMRAIGVGLVKTTQHRFETATDPAGAAWAPLLPAYAAIKRGAGILRGAAMEGGLMGSITFQAGAHSIRVGSNKIYSAIHQFGGEIRPVKAPALRFWLMDPANIGKGGRLKKGAKPILVSGQLVTIPARPYLGFGAAERLVVAEAIEKEVRFALRG
jgi:phage virion morphogenesis protein